MIIFTIFTIIYIIVILFDLKPIFKSKKYKVFWVYSAILVVSYILQTLLGFGISIPSPNIAIIDFFSIFINTK